MVSVDGLDRGIGVHWLGYFAWLEFKGCVLEGTHHGAWFGVATVSALGHTATSSSLLLHGNILTSHHPSQIPSFLRLVFTKLLSHLETIEERECVV